MPTLAVAKRLLMLGKTDRIRKSGISLAANSGTRATTRPF